MSTKSKLISLNIEMFISFFILGCLTTIVHVFFGVQAGVTLNVYKSHAQRVLRWLLWAVMCGLIGGALCGFSKENGVIPVNKNLW